MRVKKIKFKSGEVYEGEIFMGIANGYGKYFNRYGKLIYDGHWINGLPNGLGTYFNKDDDKYNGSFFNGMFNGFGKIVDSLGRVLEEKTFNMELIEEELKEELEELSAKGHDKDITKEKISAKLFKTAGLSKAQNWLNNSTFYYGKSKKKMEGLVVYISSGTVTYYGHAKDGRFDGYGVAVYPCGSVYYGEREGDLLQGEGEYFFYDGAIHNGEFREGKYHGKGRYFDPQSKEVFEGPWKNDKKSGNFVVTDKNGGKKTLFYHKGEVVSQNIIEEKYGENLKPANTGKKTSQKKKAEKVDSHADELLIKRIMPTRPMVVLPFLSNCFNLQSGIRGTRFLPLSKEINYKINENPENPWNATYYPNSRIVYSDELAEDENSESNGFSQSYEVVKDEEENTSFLEVGLKNYDKNKDTLYSITHSSFSNNIETTMEKKVVGGKAVLELVYVVNTKAPKEVILYAYEGSDLKPNELPFVSTEHIKKVLETKNITFTEMLTFIKRERKLEFQEKYLEGRQVMKELESDFEPIVKKYKKLESVKREPKPAKEIKTVNEKKYKNLTKKDMKLQQSKNLDDFIDSKFKGLIGVEEAKHELKKNISLKKLKGDNFTISDMHMAFTGNPGTGKTTVARIFAEVLHEGGILPENKLVEVNYANLYGKYVGHSLAELNDKIEEAEGGILFFDETHQLAGSDSSADFNKEIVNGLITTLENNRDSFIVIFAGYGKEMENWMKTADQGLLSRISRTVNFKAFEPEELLIIFKEMLAKEKNNKNQSFSLDRDADEIMLNKIISIKAIKGENFGNAREMRTLLRNIMENFALFDDSEDRTVINKKDLQKIFKVKKQKSIKQEKEDSSLDPQEKKPKEDDLAL